MKTAILTLLIVFIILIFILLLAVAFCIGFYFGKNTAPKKNLAELKNEIDPEQKKKYEKQMRELSNFLSFDGTNQGTFENDN